MPNPAASSSVEEKVGTAYLMTEVHGHLGSMPLAINTGFRVEITNFTSDGAGQTVVERKAERNRAKCDRAVGSDTTAFQRTLH